MSDIFVVGQILNPYPPEVDRGLKFMYAPVKCMCL